MSRGRSTNGNLLRDRITKNFPKLCNSLNCNDLFLTCLHVEGIITEDFKLELKALRSNLEKSAKVLEFLRDCRTDADFSTFVEILERSGNSKAFDIITQPINLPSSTTSYGYQGVVSGYIERKNLQQRALEHLSSAPNRNTQITFPVTVLYGFGGNGKSELARRLVQLFKQKFKDSIKITISVWINAASEASVAEGFGNFIGSTSHILETNVSDLAVFYSELKEINLLLVFDNGDDFEMIKRYLPLDDTETNVKVIITAHKQWFCNNENVNNLPVTNFTESEFREFLAKAISCPISEKDSKQIARYTGRIPTFLNLVCKGFSFISTLDTNYTILKHLTEYGIEMFTLGDGELAPGFQESDYKKSVKVVVQQQLAFMDNWGYFSQELIDLAKFILNRIAFCDPLGISEHEFFLKHPQILGKAGGDHHKIRLAIGILKEFGWIEFVGHDNMVYSIHSCYQIVLKSQLDKDVSESILHGMIEYMQVEDLSPTWSEKYAHQLAFWPNISTHPNCRSLLNYASKTKHCLVGLTRNGLMDDIKSLARAYQGPEELVYALLQGPVEIDFPSTPMYNLFCSASQETTKHFTWIIKSYYDSLNYSDHKAWIQHQVLHATLGAMFSDEQEIFKFTLASFHFRAHAGLGKTCDTLLHQAVSTGKLEFIPILIASGANINEVNGSGDTALHIALQLSIGSGLEIVKTLFANGANVNVKNYKGQSALHRASWEGNLEIVKVLVQNGANVDDKDAIGQTALHRAAWKGYFEIVKLLIEKGANVNEKDVVNQTTLHRAAWKGYLDIVKALIEKGASVNDERNCGHTALHLAVWGGSKKIVKFLVKSGATIHAVNGDGQTALEVASILKMKDIRKYLAKVKRKSRNRSEFRVVGFCRFV